MLQSALDPPRKYGKLYQYIVIGLQMTRLISNGKSFENWWMFGLQIILIEMAILIASDNCCLRELNSARNPCLKHCSYQKGKEAKEKTDEVVKVEDPTMLKFSSNQNVRNNFKLQVTRKGLGKARRYVSTRCNLREVSITT